MHKYHMALLIIVAATCTLAGCGTGNIAIKQQDLDSIKTPIHVVHWPTPALEMPSTAGAILSVTGTVVGAAVGAGAGPAVAGAVGATATSVTGAALTEHSTEAINQRISADCVIPDAGYDISDRFIKAWKRQGNAPKMVLIAQPLTGKENISGPTITFSTGIHGMYVRTLAGYLALATTVEMHDENGKLILRDHVEGDGRALKHPSYSTEEFMANHCQLLIKEVDSICQSIAQDYLMKIDSEIEWVKH